MERFRERNQSFLDALMRMQLTSFLAGAVPGTVLTLSTAAIFLYGGKLVIDGALTTGSLVALMAYHLRAARAGAEPDGPVHQPGVGRRFALARVGTVRHARPRSSSARIRAAWATVRGEIEFDRVSFRHGDDAVLDELSFRVAPGTICAILGPSGAGKSTVADLLVRFYDPDAGSIRIDGRDLRDLSLADLRRAIAAGGSIAVPVSRDRSREHRLRAAGCVPMTRSPSRRARRRDSRSHPGAAERLRHDHRRARPDAFRRRAAADRAGAGVAGGSKSAGAR